MDVIITSENSIRAKRVPSTSSSTKELADSPPSTPRLATMRETVVEDANVPEKVDSVEVSATVKVKGITFYVFDVTTNKREYQVSGRFSEIRKVSEALKSIVPNVRAPPRHYTEVDNISEKFIAKRIAEIQAYFTAILKIEKAADHPALRKFLLMKRPLGGAPAAPVNFAQSDEDEDSN